MLLRSAQPRREVDSHGLGAAPDLGEQLAKFRAACAEETAAAPGEIFNPPGTASEWYTVTIANVSVGYMHTTVETAEERPRISTMEVMDVQVSRGTDKSRMAFETVFHEDALEAKDPLAMDEAAALRGGVQIMAYDQRFANSEVRMNVSFAGGAISLTSHNGESEHVSEVHSTDSSLVPRPVTRANLSTL